MRRHRGRRPEGDAAFLALHGAMRARGRRRGRAAEPHPCRHPADRGGPRLPRTTARTVDNATVIAGYCTSTSTRARRPSRRRAGRRALSRVRSPPLTVWGSRPMMRVRRCTPIAPMKHIMDTAHGRERRVERLGIRRLPSRRHPHISCSAVIAAIAAPTRARLSSTACSAWRGPARAPSSTRARRCSQYRPCPDASATLIVLVDHGDNTASGGTQDVMSVIEEVMKQGLQDVAGPIPRLSRASSRRA